MSARTPRKRPAPVSFLAPHRPATAAMEPLRVGDNTANVAIDQVPAPYDPHSGETLDPRERADLKACEQAIAGLQKAFAVAGKALATINRARLYRETHDTFTDYLAARGISESQAYRLMDSWEVYALLEAAGVTVLNERQTRELVAAFRKHGGPATVALAKAVGKHTEKPTAAAIETARKALPAELPPEPRQLERVIEEATVRALPRKTSPNGGETTAAPVPTQTRADHGEITQDQVTEGADAIATLERATAQQQQIYDAVPPSVLTAAMLYDPNRGERLRHRLRQLANRTAYRVRDPATEDQETTEN